MPEKLTTRRVQAVVAAMRPIEIRDTAAPGLVLRVRKHTWAWSVRRTVMKSDYRLDLGDVWSLEEAREIAFEVDKRIREDRDPWFRSPGTWPEWYEPHRRRKLGIAEPYVPPPMPVEARGRADLPELYWPEAVDLWVAEVARTTKPSTAISYRNDLVSVPEMKRFRDWKIAAVTKRAAAEAVADVHRRGKQRQAECCASSLRSLFRFHGLLENSRRSGLEEDRMHGLKAPPRSLMTDDQFEERENRDSDRVPDRLEVGRLVRAFQSQASPRLERDRLAGLLLLYSVQRRMSVAVAKKKEFHSHGDGGLWTIPPLHRKAGSKALRSGKQTRPHVVYLPSAAWAVVRRAMALSPPDSVHLFTGEKPRRAGAAVGHMTPHALNKLFLAVAGNQVSPHDVRRAFATTYGNEVGLTIEQAKLVLDHSEAVASGDVTRRHYKFDPRLGEKTPIMEGYVAWVDACAKLRD